MATPTPGSPISAKSTVSIILDSQPSCLEFAKQKDILVVGTYNLEAREGNGEEVTKNEVDSKVETTVQKRTGSLLIFRVTEQAATLRQTKVLPYAVLDLHFAPGDSYKLAVATSVGSVCFFSCDSDHDGGLTFIKSIQLCDPSILVLSVTYQNSHLIERLSPVAVSLSNGHLAVFRDGQKEQDIVTIPVHSQEAWTVAWSKTFGEGNMSRHALYSGGDDSTLCKHSENFSLIGSKGEATIDDYQPVSRDIRTHGAGVTAIAVLPMLHEDQEILMTGSYDEYVRILIPPSHTRGRSDVLAERHLGGGVWRISSPFEYSQGVLGDNISFKMLASCMHVGARVLEIQRESGTWSIRVAAMFTEHESMNYASDYRESNGGTIFVSTSFYDRRLCIWNIGGVSDDSGDVQRRP